MPTIMLVGLAPRSKVAERLFQAGFFVLSADDVMAALGMLSAIRVDGFVIDVRDAAVGGELLFKRLHESPAWRELPVVITNAGPDQCERLAQQAFRGAIITPCDRAADAIVAALRPLLQPNATRPRERPAVQASTTLRSGSASTVLNRPTEWELKGMGA
jgi:hypothetical protein